MSNSLSKWLGIFGAIMGSMAMGLSFSLINANLESIYQHFNATILELQWMINIYGIFIASTLVTMGRLGDIFGRKKIYLIGTALFGIAMLGAGLAPNPTIIIAFQALFGIAGAILLPLSQALLVDIFPDEKKSIAVSLWASSGGIALSLGPIVGGILLNFFSWRSIFLINVPFALLAIVLTSLFTKESKTEGEPTTIDWPGVILLTATIGTFILATVQFNLWATPLIVSLYLLSLILLIALLIIEKKVPMPIIRKELFQSRMFFFSCAGNFCMIIVFWAGIFLIPFYIQKQLGYSPLETGILMLAFSMPVGVISPTIGYLYEKIGPKILIAIGFLLLTLSALMQIFYMEGTSVFFVTSATFLLGVGFSFIWTPTTTGAISAISRNFAGIAAGTFITIQEIGGNIGLAISATISRSSPQFNIGFHHAMWFLFYISLTGILTAFFLPKKPKTLRSLR